MKCLRQLAFAAGMLVTTTGVALAASQDRVNLSGAVKAGVESVSIQEIEAIGVTTISARSPSSEQKRSFTGVWLDDFVSAFGAENVASVGMTAIDYYQVRFERSEWERSRILLATRKDGKLLEFETRGPLRVIVDNFDPNDGLHQELTPKWIWMITEITFND